MHPYLVYVRPLVEYYSAFEVFKVSRFAVIQEEICCRSLWRRVKMLASRSEGEKDKKS